MTSQSWQYGDMSHERHKTLTPAQEQAAFAAYRAGDKQARDRIILANLRFVRQVANHYANAGIEKADLIGIGVEGLTRAVDKFNPATGFKFISYAVWWVRQAIMQAIADQSRTVSMPAYHMSFITRVSKLTQQITNELGRAPGPHEILEALPPRWRKAYERDYLKGGSLDMGLAPESLDDLKEEFDREMEDPRPLADETMGGMTRRFLESALGRLPEREEHALRAYYGFDTGEPRTLDDIGQGMGVSRERVRQMLSTGLKRLQHHAYATEQAARRRIELEKTLR